MGYIGCKNICDHYDKVPMNAKIEKKFCTSCYYNTIVDKIICGCCGTKYRINRQRYGKPTGKPFGRPHNKELEAIKIHPLFDY